MNNYDYTTLAGIKEAAGELIRKGHNQGLYICVDLEMHHYAWKSDLTYAFVSVSAYINQEGPLGPNVYHGEREELTPDGIAAAFADAEAFIGNYKTEEVERLEGVISSLSTKLAEAKKQLKQAKK